jgi:CheY-like chemotaxis protein
VIEAGDGVVGLNLAKIEKPDLILLDISLPRMSGLEVARHLREDSAVSSIPVLFLTGLVPESELDSGPSSSYISKPFSPDLLVKRVAEALHGVAA